MHNQQQKQQQQQQQPKREPVPLGPSQELESLLPRKHEKHASPRRHYYSCSSSRRTIVPLVVLAILASLSLFHRPRYHQPNDPHKSSWTVSETARPTMVQETTAGTTSSKATEPASTTIQTNVPDTASTTKSAAQATTKATTLPSTGIAGRTRFFTSYQISWGAFHPCIFPYCMTSTSATSGCLLNAGPSIRIYCGPGGTLNYVSQSNCNLDQHGSNHSSLYCQGSWDNLVDTVYVTCSGTHDKALQMDVHLEGHMYRCNQVLSEHSTWNGMVQEKGGSVGQQVVVATRRSAIDATWSEITSASQTATCSTGVQCLDTYVSCRGPSACEATVPYLVATADLDKVVAAAVVSPGAVGDVCTMDYTCQSGKCDDGVCREQD